MRRLLEEIWRAPSCRGIINTNERTAPSFIPFSNSKAAKAQTCLIPPTYYLSKLPIDKFSEQLFHDLYTLEPFGMDNPKPVFLSQNTKPSFIKMLGEDHLLFGISSKCVFGFQKGDLYEQIKKPYYALSLYNELLPSKNF